MSLVSNPGVSMSVSDLPRPVPRVAAARCRQSALHARHRRAQRIVGDVVGVRTLQVARARALQPIDRAGVAVDVRDAGVEPAAS